MVTDRLADWRRSKRPQLLLVAGAAMIPMQVGGLLNLNAESESLRLLGLILVMLGLASLTMWMARQYKALVRELQSPSAPLSSPERDAVLARLNRLAAENKDLVEAMGKVVVPVVVALVALVGVVLA